MTAEKHKLFCFLFLSSGPPAGVGILAHAWGALAHACRPAYYIAILVLNSRLGTLSLWHEQQAAWRMAAKP